MTLEKAGNWQGLDHVTQGTGLQDQDLHGDERRGLP
jgi:hypothetical protein